MNRQDLMEEINSILCTNYNWSRLRKLDLERIHEELQKFKECIYLAQFAVEGKLDDTFGVQTETNLKMLKITEILPLENGKA